jgi:hypothetical protein
MKKYRIRFNKSRGQQGRGSMEHVWRVFEGDKEYLFKNLDITVPIKSEKDENGVDYNIFCTGELIVDRETSTAIIVSELSKDDTVEKSSPEVTLICISNVYSRLMRFKNKGDVEVGHKHTFDHGTLLSSGSVLYEIIDENNNNTISSKVFHAPNFIFVDKDKKHRITALKDNTVCACIHALKTNDQELLDPDFLIEPLIGDNKGIIPKTILSKTGKHFNFPAIID